MTQSNIKDVCPDCGNDVSREEAVVVKQSDNRFEYYCPHCHPDLKDQFKNPIDTAKKAFKDLTEDDYGYLGYKQKFRY